MPTEGMSLRGIHEQHKEGITEFLPSINHNISKRVFEAGSITDDTLHTLILIDCLYEHIENFTSEVYLKYLADWYACSPIADLVIGPSSLKAIVAYREGKENVDANYAVSNGAMMKISPIGFIASTKADIVSYVEAVNRPTHASNICFTSACVVAYVISCFARDEAKLENLETRVYEMIAYCGSIGFDMPSASLRSRVEMAMKLARLNLSRMEFLIRVSNLIGTSILCTETLPCALAIIKYTKGDMKETASLCASIGGDTDTIGAIACSICGSLGSLPMAEEVTILETVNHLDIKQYVTKIETIINEC